MIEFIYRHIGPTDDSIQAMLDYLGYDSLDAFTATLVPDNIQIEQSLNVPDALSETEASQRLLEISQKNQVYRSLIGQGFYGTVTPPVIRRSVLENPAWYSGYTPYQAEISQGRLEALFNFQTMVSDLTGFPIANASLLDEPTAVAEAIMLCNRAQKSRGSEIFLSDNCHPQTLTVCRARAELLGWSVVVGDWSEYEPSENSFAAVIQYPETDGGMHDFSEFTQRMHAGGVLVVAATDLLALTLFEEPASWDADVAVGSTQRFGCPVGFGGPHAAFFATKEAFKRLIPGRIVGRSVDSSGQNALRLALQTREQHIRREKATSNICTAQVLPAVMASMYALYHGANNLRDMAESVHAITNYLARRLSDSGYNLVMRQAQGARFDTVRIQLSADRLITLRQRALEEGINFRYYSDTDLGFSIDETVDYPLLNALARIFDFELDAWASILDEASPAKNLFRKSAFLTHPIFNRNRSELEITRYMYKLAEKDLTLVDSMIPLGSCTMKLNAASELEPVSWEQFNQLHPLVPKDQAEGYRILIEELSEWLAEITGFHSVSLQPNSGASGEYAGLVAIRSYHESQGAVGAKERNICLIPESAHGTNPASASLAGFKVVSVACSEGCVDLADLKSKAEQYSDHLGAFMLTYPSTYGIYESSVKEICSIIHRNGGQVYLDGANMNAMVGLCRPGDFGADVCHLNLHKTFCIPHGGGGPGSGPIGVAEHLSPFVPSNPFELNASFARPVAGANFGSASILSIPWMYIQSMGARGLKKASQVAILNANYLLKRLSGHYSVLYKGASGLIAHEGIIDLRPFKKELGIDVNDICKRLIDYGFHAPTMSWPVIGTLMIEPTESETIEELDRFVDAMIAIREEIRAVEEGRADAEDNVLKHAPFTVATVSADIWPYSFSRSDAAWPKGLDKRRKFWSPVSRIDNALGDRVLICSCPPVEELADA